MNFKKQLLVATLTTTSVLALSACEDLSITLDETTYDVSFTTGDKATTVETHTVIEGDKVVKPTDPTHSEGNQFIEWLYEGDTYDFDTVVSSDMTLDALWANTTFTVNFETGYESDGVTVDSQSVAEGTTVSVSDLPYRTGYEITGWTLNDLDYDFSETITESITLKAVWESVTTYTVTLDTTTFKETIDDSLKTQVINEGRSIVLPEGSFTNKDNETDILTGWLTYDATNYTVVEFDTTDIKQDVVLIPSWVKSFNPSQYYTGNRIEDTTSEWKVDSTYSSHMENPFNDDSSDLVVKIQRALSSESSTSNSVNKFTTSGRVSGGQSLISFDIYAVESQNTALQIKMYANNSTSSNAEIARIKLNGTTTGTDIQWGQYSSGGWNNDTSTSFSFSNTTINSNYKIVDNQWYTIQVLFEYVLVEETLELYAKLYLNGIQLSNEAIETNGYLTAVPAVNSILENNPANADYITGINFSADKQSTEEQANNVVYINNLYVDYK